MVANSTFTAEGFHRYMRNTQGEEWLKATAESFKKWMIDFSNADEDHAYEAFVLENAEVSWLNETTIKIQTQTLHEMNDLCKSWNFFRKNAAFYDPLVEKLFFTSEDQPELAVTLTLDPKVRYEWNTAYPLFDQRNDDSAYLPWERYQNAMH